MRSVAVLLSLCALIGSSLAQSTPSNSPEQYTYTYRTPNGCTIAEANCDYFVGIQRNEGNSDYLDIYLEGTADGWVAIGFSTTADMFNADVLGCVRTITAIGAVDTWNPSTRTNELDATQDITENSVEYNNGRINCDLTRLIAGSDPMQDLNLLAENYWLLYGTGVDQLTSSTFPIAFNYHGLVNGVRNTPDISSTRVDIFGSGSLAVRAQGHLVLIALSVIAVAAVFFAA